MKIWHFITEGATRAACGARYRFPRRFTDRDAEVTCPRCRELINPVDPDDDGGWDHRYEGIHTNRKPAPV